MEKRKELYKFGAQNSSPQMHCRRTRELQKANRADLRRELFSQRREVYIRDIVHQEETETQVDSPRWASKVDEHIVNIQNEVGPSLVVNKSINKETIIDSKTSRKDAFLSKYIKWKKEKEETRLKQKQKKGPKPFVPAGISTRTKTNNNCFATILTKNKKCEDTHLNNTKRHTTVSSKPVSRRSIYTFVPTPKKERKSEVKLTKPIINQNTHSKYANNCKTNRELSSKVAFWPVPTSQPRSAPVPKSGATVKAENNLQNKRAAALKEPWKNTQKNLAGTFKAKHKMHTHKRTCRTSATTKSIKAALMSPRKGQNEPAFLNSVVDFVTSTTRKSVPKTSSSTEFFNDSDNPSPIDVSITNDVLPQQSKASTASIGLKRKFTFVHKYDTTTLNEDISLPKPIEAMNRSVFKKDILKSIVPKSRKHVTNNNHIKRNSLKQTATQQLSAVKPQPPSATSKFSFVLNKTFTPDCKSARKHKGSTIKPVRLASLADIDNSKRKTSKLVATKAIEKIEKIVDVIDNSKKETSKLSVAVAIEKAENIIDVKALEQVSHFRKQLEDEFERLYNLCDIWEAYKRENIMTLEGTDGNDLIDVTIGQTKLLASKKFQQYRSLIDRCEASAKGVDIVDDGSEDTKRISPIDLEGFWAMLGLQIDNINKRFENLECWKANNWMDPDVPDVTVLKKRKIATITTMTKKNNNSTKPKPSKSLRQFLEKCRVEKQNTAVKDTMNANKENIVVNNNEAAEVTVYPRRSRRSENASTFDQQHTSSPRSISVIVRDRKSHSIAPTVISIPSSKSRTSLNLNEPFETSKLKLQRSYDNGELLKTALITAHTRKSLAIMDRQFSTPKKNSDTEMTFKTPKSQSTLKSILKTPGSVSSKQKTVNFSAKLDVKRFKFTFQGSQSADEAELTDKSQHEQGGSPHDRVYRLRSRKVILRPSSEFIIP